MPEISRFFGIIIALNYNDHPPPHFHARYAAQKAIIAIRDPRLLEGYLSPRVLNLVMEWAGLHRSQLLENWERARRGEPLVKIPGLE
jgi:hypothetical protein